MGWRLVTSFFIAVNAVSAYAQDSCSSCVKDFAIYNPGVEFSSDGVWDEEVVALKALSDAFKWSSTEIDHKSINQGDLGVGNSQKYRALVAPGGLAYYRAIAVTPEGNEKIRAYVRGGGTFIGFCAGAYWASEKVSTAITASQAGGNITGKSDYSIYDYSLKLLPGMAQGPLGWMPWKNGTNYNFELAEIDTTIPTMKAIGIPKTTRFLYGGGPFFPNLPKGLDGLEVWARALPPPKAPKGLIGAHEPIIIRYRLGQGNVILFGFHPDVLVRSTLDRNEINYPISEEKVSWAMGDQSIEEINLHSWNIVHAAFQIARNETVTALTKLPS